MAKQTYKCNNCKNIIHFYKNENIEDLICPNCQKKSQYIKVFNFNITNEDDNNRIDEVGELTQKYIEENKIILDSLKKEKMEWK